MPHPSVGEFMQNPSKALQLLCENPEGILTSSSVGRAGFNREFFSITVSEMACCQTVNLPHGRTEGRIHRWDRGGGGGAGHTWRTAAGAYGVG